MRTRRSIHTLGALVIGGAQRILKDLLPALKNEGLAVELLVFSRRLDSFGQSILDDFREREIPVHIGPANAFRPQTVSWLSRYLRELDASDVLHLHLHYCERAYYCARWLHRRKYRLLRTLHNTNPPRPGLERWAFDHSDVRCSVACGDAIASAYQELVQGELHTVVSGINFDWPRHDPEHRDERLEALGLDRDKTHYLTVGRMRYPTGEKLLEGTQKGYDQLLRAWRQNNLGEQGGCLHLLGDGSARAELEALVAGDPSVHFHGAVANVSEWLGAIDTYVMPSRWEGLPIAGMEAAVTGINCIFSDIEPLRELGYSAASYYPLGDLDALAARLEERLGRFDTAAEADSERARELFGIGRTARELVAIYEQL